MSSEIKILSFNPIDKRLEKLATEAREQGYFFIDRLIKEAENGQNTFDNDGECFCGIFIDGGLVGCGGINLDPYVKQRVGRLRHVYISQPVRRIGLASTLVQYLLEQSKPTFSFVRLRTSDASADSFYEALGFHRIVDISATHIIEL